MKKYLTLKKLLANFFISKKAAVAIEIAFVVPILVSFIFAIIETALMISNRSGIEEVMRTAARMSFSSGALRAYAADQGWPATLENDEIMIRFITQRLTSFLSNPANAMLARDIYDNSLDLASDNPSRQFPPQPIGTFTSFGSIGVGQSKQYVKLQIRYEYEYMGPIHRLVPGMGTSQIIQSELFYRRD